ncbi:10886_t:CDS:1 [Racocetra fulgida]|uniref:10886_t:CDS:1 n=1 Tax=Racocetra fulgida TaxID=60492 RepID=A0A9N8YW06_9GLOM|nr:10886_t:CDS:1 [Racocetra fulgida]
MLGCWGCLYVFGAVNVAENQLENGTVNAAENQLEKLEEGAIPQEQVDNSSSQFGEIEVALPQITESFEELMKKSIKELKIILEDRRISTIECVEKEDLVK